MRTSQQLIRLVLDDPNFQEFESLPHPDSPFQHFRLTLLDRRYRGFPDFWQVAVLTAPDKPSAGEHAEELLEGARELTREVVNTQNRKQPQPLLVLSDDPDVLVSRLRFDNELVFFLDSRSLPDRMPQTRGNFRRSPLMAAVRAKLDDHQISRLLLVPYLPSDPAVGWRFSGSSGFGTPFGKVPSGSLCTLTKSTLNMRSSASTTMPPQPLPPLATNWKSRSASTSTNFIRWLT